MKFNISKKWLLKAANNEDRMPVSAGEFSYDLIADDTSEKQRVVAEDKKIQNEYIQHLKKNDEE
jgi:hypothetical protein